MASPHPHNPYVPPFLPPSSPIPSYATPTPPTAFMPFSPPPGTPYYASPPFSSSPSYPHPSYHPPPPEHPPSFTPFFTLISNPGSTVHKHPIVHYVFSDDDFDPVTETTLAAAAAEDAVTTPVPGSGPGRQGSGQGRRQPPPKDRVVIVDVGSDGETVVAAHSLSKEWQVVGVGISSAPQWMAGNNEDVPGGGVGGSGGGGSGGGSGGSGGGGGGGGAGGGVVTGQGGLMLTVEGTERVGLQGAKKTESLYELAEMFSERMALIRRVIDYGEKSAAGS